MYRQSEFKTLIFVLNFVIFLYKTHLFTGCVRVKNLYAKQKEANLKLTSFFNILIYIFIYYLMLENVQASNVGVSEIFISFLSLPVVESSWAIGLYNLL